MPVQASDELDREARVCGEIMNALASGSPLRLTEKLRSDTLKVLVESELSDEIMNPLLRRGGMHDPEAKELVGKALLELIKDQTDSLSKYRPDKFHDWEDIGQDVAFDTWQTTVNNGDFRLYNPRSFFRPRLLNILYELNRGQGRRVKRDDNWARTHEKSGHPANEASARELRVKVEKVIAHMSIELQLTYQLVFVERLTQPEAAERITELTGEKITKHGVRRRVQNIKLLLSQQKFISELVD